jgi:hypothetical protein
MKSITKFGALLAAIVCIGSTAAMQPAQAADYCHFDRHERQRVERQEWRNELRNERAYNNYNYDNNGYHPVLNNILYRLGL